MNRPPCQSRPRGAAFFRRGFSLMELLVVVGILILLAALAMPAISGVQTSFQLSKAGALLQDHLQLARQLAITRNEPIFVSLWETSDELNHTSLNTLAISRLEKDGTRRILERPVRLPLGFSISGNADWSSLVNLDTETLTLPSGAEVSARHLRFEPSGSTSLTSSGSWYLTVFNHQRSDAPDANFITIALDPVTARVFTYQP